MQLSKEKLNKGFTLVEIIVALGIFLVAVSISLGSLVSLFNANTKSQTLASVMNNLNYTIESMVRNIKFATTYHCGASGSLTAPQSCNTGDIFLAISTTTAPTLPTSYRLQGTKMQVSMYGGAYTDITASDVTITHARFYIFNTTSGDANQPYVLMVVRGYAGAKPSSQTTFDIQTVVSQRALDL